MSKHQYRIRVDYIADNHGNDVNRSIEFDAPNHDDIFRIVDLTAQREGFTPQMAQRFAVGLKLFGEILLENKDHPLCAQLRPHMVEMMKIIKDKK